MQSSRQGIQTRKLYTCRESHYGRIVLRQKDVIVERSLHEFGCTVRDAALLKNKGLTQKCSSEEACEIGQKVDPAKVRCSIFAFQGRVGILRAGSPNVDRDDADVVQQQLPRSGAEEGCESVFAGCGVMTVAHRF